VASVAAAKIDPRLATVRKAFVAVDDELGDGRPVAACLAERLSKFTPIEPVAARTEADVVLTVEKASGGRHPHAILRAALPDGTTLWQDDAQAKGFNLGGRDMACPLAENLISKLRDAMKKARDGK
jgi:hypothetical protein